MVRVNPGNVERYDRETGVRVARIALPHTDQDSLGIQLGEDGSVAVLRSVMTSRRCEPTLPMQCELWGETMCLDLISPTGTVSSYAAGGQWTQDAAFADTALLTWSGCGDDCGAASLKQLPEGFTPARSGWTSPRGNASWQGRPRGGALAPRPRVLANPRSKAPASLHANRARYHPRAPDCRAALRTGTDKEPILITHHGLPSAYLVDVERFEWMQQRMTVLEGIAQGEEAVAEGRVATHAQAKARLAGWLK